MIDCGPLESPENGMVNLEDGSVYGSEARYNCSSNYLLEGTYLRICLENGEWSGEKPECNCDIDLL